MSVTDTEAIAILAAERLLARCAHAADAGDGRRYSEQFTRDAVIDGHPRGPFKGREAIARFYAERRIQDPPHRHHVTTIDARFDADGVLRSTSYFEVIGGGLIAGVDEHEFARDGEQWLIKRKVTRLEFRAGP